MKRLTMAIVFCAMTMGFLTNAEAVSCYNVQVEHLQVQPDGSNVIYFNNSWHKLTGNSNETDPVVADRMVSIVLAAMLSGKTIHIYYSGSTCTSSDTNARPTKVRINQ